MRYSIQIVDQSQVSSAKSPEFVDEIHDSHFKEFVSSTSNHALRSVGGEAATRVPPGDADFAMSFVRRPLVRNDHPESTRRLSSDAARSRGGRVAASPWVKVEFGEQSNCPFGATFVLSERQVLVDQALMAGSHAEQVGPPEPISESTFEDYTADYTNNVLLAPTSDVQGKARTAIRERLPAEIWWLFDQSWQSTFAPFSMEARETMRAVLQRTLAGYTEMTAAVLDAMLASPGRDVHYRTINDLKGVSEVRNYRIDRLH